MTELRVSISQPFTSPTWDSNFVVFTTSGKAVPEERAKEYLASASKFAVKFGVYLVPEPFVMMEIVGMCLIDPEGKVIGAQQKLFDPEPSKGSKEHVEKKSNNQISLINTPYGKIFLAVGDDVYRPELMRIVYNMGAKLVVNSQNIPTTLYGNHRIIGGSWNAAQSNNLLVISVTNYKNSIAAPKDVTRRGDGFIMSPNDKVPSSAQFDLDILLDVGRPEHLPKSFYTNHRRELME